MNYVLDQGEVVRMAARISVVKAARQGAGLVGLWPLDDAKQLDNDAKYGETLQVRMTRSLARVMTDEDVTIPDAEFVYEGAQDIPGRPQSLVDALLAANEAYEGMSGFGESGETDLVTQAATALGAVWSQEEAGAARLMLAQADRALCPQGPLEPTSDPSVFATRLASICTAFAALMKAVGCGREHVEAVLPLVLVLNGLCERSGLPPLFMTDEQIVGLAGLADGGGKSSDSQADALADYICPLAGQEWDRHRQDILWDPEEAKRKAKEDDERKSREALNAKFAHVPEDPDKPPVEL